MKIFTKNRMSFEKNLMLKKKKEVPLSEEDSMRQFYEPIKTQKHRVLTKWLKAPER